STRRHHRRTRCRCRRDYNRQMKTSTPAAGIVLKDSTLFREACCLAGGWIAGGPASVIEVDNPATGGTLGTVPRLGRAETRAAIDAAARAFPGWRRKTAKERAIVMRRWFELM